MRYFHSWSSSPDQSNNDNSAYSATAMTTTTLPSFYPAQDPLASAFHLFFATIFASHANIYQAIPGCIPIPLFYLKSEQFDVEFLRRYERNLFFSSLQESRQGWEEKRNAITAGNITPSTTSTTTTPLHNIYANTSFASASHFVSEAHLIEGEWLGYYSFQDPEDEDGDQETAAARTVNNNNNASNTNTNQQQQQQQNNNNATTATAAATTMEDWFDGPMRLTIKIVPLEDASGEPINQSSWLSRWLDNSEDSDRGESMTEPRKRRKINNTSSVSHPSSANYDKSLSRPRSRHGRKHSKQQFPASHLRTCPLTRFEGTGVDNLGNFTISGLVDDTEEGQVTWEKTYVDSAETWEYSGRFVWPMGLCGRWGDEEYGGPWWMWKVSDNEAVLPASAVSTVSK